MALKRSHLFAALVCLIVTVSVMLSTIGVNAGGDYTLRLVCMIDKNVPVEEMEWNVFRVAEKQNGKYVLIGDFANCNFNIDKLTDDNMYEFTDLILGTIFAEKIQPLAVKSSDSNGILDFTELEHSVYFAYPTDEAFDSYILTQVGVNGEAVTTVYPKLNDSDSPGGGSGSKAEKYRVYKEWVDDEEVIAERPTSVIVDIYKNGVLQYTQVLSDENGWYFEWPSDKNGSRWTIAERTHAKGYRVTMDKVYDETQNLEAFILENAYDESFVKETVSTTTTVETDVPVTGTNTEVIETAPVIGTTSTATETTGTSDSTGSGATTVSTQTTTTTSSTTTEKTPQTGQLWWPVPFLCIGGIALFGVGYKMTKRNDE